MWATGAGLFCCASTGLSCKQRPHERAAVQAGQRMDRLRDELVHYEGCAAHHGERQAALHALRRRGISDEAAERELVRVPPLPFDPSYVRPAVFADSPAGHTQDAAWRAPPPTVFGRPRRHDAAMLRTVPSKQRSHPGPDRGL